MAYGTRTPGLLGGMPMPGIIGGFGGGTFNMDGSQVTPSRGMPMPMQAAREFPSAAPQQAAQQPRKKGGGFLNTVGRIADVLALIGGQQPIYGPMKAADAERERDEQTQAALEAYASNPNDQGSFSQLLINAPELALKIRAGLTGGGQRNDTIEDFNWYKTLSQEDRAIYDEMHPVYRTGPDGLPYPMARASARSLPPDTLPADFDFGGGGAGNSAGTFRP